MFTLTYKNKTIKIFKYHFFLFFFLALMFFGSLYDYSMQNILYSMMLFFWFLIVFYTTVSFRWVAQSPALEPTTCLTPIPHPLWPSPPYGDPWSAQFSLLTAISALFNVVCCVHTLHQSISSVQCFFNQPAVKANVLIFTFVSVLQVPRRLPGNPMWPVSTQDRLHPLRPK